jgi:hypothetical protein
MAEIALPITYAALYNAALAVREAWIAAAVETNAPAAYVRGLAQRGSIVYPWEGDPLAAAVVNVAPGAARVEYDQAAYHWPDTIRWGQTPGSRLSKRGTWYLIVPFRAKTRALPKKIYAVARQLQAGQRLTAGPSQGSRVHAPGLIPYQPANPANVRPGARASIYEGLQRTPRVRGGSTYSTFRTVTPTSPGWHMPPRPGLHLAAQVQAAMMPQITAALTRAVQQDMAALVQQRLGGDRAP